MTAKAENGQFEDTLFLKKGVVFKLKPNLMILPIKTRESDASIKTCYLREAKE